MKNTLYSLFVFLFAVLVTADVFAQAVPEGFNFQAVARGADGELLVDQEVTVLISVLKGTEEGDVVYTETHLLTTSPIGLIQLVIGEGTPVESADFSAIDWSSDNHYVSLGIDVDGGAEFEDLGTTRLLSVPYALVAKDVINGNGIAEEITAYDLDTSQPDSSFTVDVSGTQSGTAIIASANTDSSNVGLEGHANSMAGNPSVQVGTYGQAMGEGTGNHIGTYGFARASSGSMRGAYGGINVSDNPNSDFDIGVSGQAFGELTAPENFSVGVYGQNTVTGGSEAWGTGGYAGGHGINKAFRGRANSLEGNEQDQIGAWLQANGTGTGNHYGVWARAAGLGVNRGIYATADGGSENYAGWFEGDVVITGNLTVNGATSDSSVSGGGNVSLPLDLAGPNGNRSVMLSSEGESGEDGMLRLSNTDGYSRVTMFADGYFYDESDQQVWSGAGGAWFSDKNGAMNVKISSRGADYTNGLIEVGDGSGSSYLDLYTVSGAEGYSAGRIRNSDTNGNYSLMTSSNFYSYNGTAPNAIGWFGSIGGKGFSQLLSYDSETYLGGVLSGFWAGNPALLMENGDEFHTVYLEMLTDEEASVDFGQLKLASTDGSEMLLTPDRISTSFFTQEVGKSGDEEAAYMYLHGKSSPNFQMGGETWGNSDMAFLHMYGRTPTADDGWYQENVRISVGTDDAYDAGYLSLYKSDIANKTREETININGYDGNITATGTITGTTVSQTSDRRLKTNIEPLSNALDNTLKLRGVSYNWKDESKPANQIGVIAQEVEEIYPEFVHTDDEGMKSVNYAQMVSVLIEAVKELNAKIEVLEGENTELRAQVDEIDTMKEQINKIMNMIESSSTNGSSSFAGDK